MPGDRVIDDLDAGRIDTSWSDASGAPGQREKPVQLESRPGMIVERRHVRVAAAAQAVYRDFTGIGGARGWYFAAWTWRLRGALDRMLGGVGLRRGRRHPDTLRIGNALEFWRVEDLQADRSVRLRAEMKLPGRAWLQSEVRDADDGTSQLEQTAAFIPKGLPGLAYWYGLHPFHAWIFGGLVKAIARRAARMETTGAGERRP